MEENILATYGLESDYALIDESYLGLIKSISIKLSKTRSLEQSTAIILEM